VGYAGGSKANPTYHSLGDHSETIQIEYDPSEISYEELLDVFWESHNPSRQSYSRQYMSIIFYHDEEQQRLAFESRDRQAAKRGKIYTEIVQAGEFYLAEDYHQKYYLQNTPQLISEFEAMYADSTALVDSTAAARLNGYAGGNGTPEQLEREMGRLGLSPAGQEFLQQRISR
jgi:methionine-S-sulfoxide reductase